MGTRKYENEPKLRELMAQGKRPLEVAAALGVTRNAVIGKASRLGLKWPPRPVRERSPGKGKRKPAAQLARALARLRRLRPLEADEYVAMVAAGKAPPSIGIMELQSWTCRWPTWDVPRRYCGADVEKLGKPYCPYHNGLAWREGGRRG